MGISSRAVSLLEIIALSDVQIFIIVHVIVFLWKPIS